MLELLRPVIGRGGLLVTVTHSEKTGDVSASFTGDAGYPNVLEGPDADELVTNIVGSLAQRIDYGIADGKAVLTIQLKTG